MLKNAKAGRIISTSTAKHKDSCGPETRGKGGLRFPLQSRKSDGTCFVGFAPGPAQARRIRVLGRGRGWSRHARLPEAARRRLAACARALELCAQRAQPLPLASRRGARATTCDAQCTLPCMLVTDEKSMTLTSPRNLG